MSFTASANWRGTLELVEAYPHLKLEREQPTRQIRLKTGRGAPPPADIPAHGRRLQQDLKAAQDANEATIGGFDDRPLFKLNVGTLSPEEIEKGFPGIEVVSQEDGGYALVFASQEALEEFEARLGELSDGGKPKYQQILFALQSIEVWTSEDRKGWALKIYGFPEEEPFPLDVELWPLGRSDERQQLIATFETWFESRGARWLDRIHTDSLIAYRLQLTRALAEEVLRHRDVRLVDLTPRIGLELEVLYTDIQDIPPVPHPPDNAPVVAILDSGIAAGHPLLAPAVGDAQGFINPNHDPADDAGHGTLVAGIALYDDVAQCAQSKSFVPQLRILSGRVLDHQAQGDPRFIENIVEEAVRYFHEHYGCKVFNLSYGDLNKPYRGGRVRGLAYTLDRLARELDVLFVVPTGNLQDLPQHGAYPDFLFEDEACLIDPAPALNVLTVGSLARWDRAVNAARYPNDLTDTPVAQKDFPSPFTRCGASVRDAIKPDLTAYGGNWAVDPRTGKVEARWLGELSTSKEFAIAGRLLAAEVGTSFAAPHIAHLAARILAELPDAGVNLLRALLVANAGIPNRTLSLFQQDEDQCARTVGYGMIDADTLYRSTEEQVSLYAEDALVDKHNHFYEVPIPGSFSSSGKRLRRITIAVAHCPPVRTTRLDYKASRFQFRAVEANDLDEAVDAFDRATKGQVDSIREFLTANRSAYTANRRGCGTVQASTWSIQRSRHNRLFVVVSRNDHAWGDAMVGEREPYALVIRLRDRDNADARLYTEIRAQLQARQRDRARARV